MEEIEIAGQVMLPVGSQLLSVDYVNWRGRAWLAPICLEENGVVRPLRLIAPRFALGFTPPNGPEVLDIFRQIPLSSQVLNQGYISVEMAPLIEIIEDPNVRISRPATTAALRQ